MFKTYIDISRQNYIYYMVPVRQGSSIQKGGEKLYKKSHILRSRIYP